jgi:hypothetical protein
MTHPKAQPPIRILSERAFDVSPSPGLIERQVAITYQIAPLPPNVVFVKADELPDYSWRKANPATTELPASVQKLADDHRRKLILEHSRSRGSKAPRTI